MKLTLVGAGPGDPDLITVKGVKALQNAKAILYDSLANKELLAYASEDCKLLYVGKRHGCRSAKQEAIHDLILHCTSKYGYTVRLKGGDPFVFGRGFEEMEFAQSHGIEVDVIPGISSTIAVPEMAGIPLTCRGINESYMVTTATLRDGELSNDIRKAAQTTTTLVVLMGLHKLDMISDLFIQHGKDKLPIAVIQNGTLPNQKIAFGTPETIVEEVQKQDIGSPALIIAGEVVSLHPEYRKSLLNYSEK